MAVESVARGINHRVLHSSRLPYLALSLYRDWQRFNRVQRELTAGGSVSPFSFEGLRERKTSATLFVLGSGASVNAIDQAQWDYIRQHDSVGFNFWLVHPFVPTYFFWEMPGEEVRRGIFAELLERKQQAYRDTPIVVKRVWPNMIPAVKQIVQSTPALEHLNVVSLDLPPKSNYSRTEIARSIRQLQRYAVVDLLLKRSMLLHRRGTLSELITFACGLDYKRVVLCGVDLLATDYFFDIEVYKWEGEPLPIPPKLPQTVHSTIDPSKADLPVDEVLYLLRDELLAPREMTLELLSEASRLYPALGVAEIA